MDWRQVVEALSDPVLACGTDGLLVAVNPAAARLLAWEAASLVGQPLACIVPPRLHTVDGEPVHRYLLDRVSELSGRVVRVAMARRDGVELEVDLALSAAQPPGGPALLVATLRRRLASVPRAAEVLGRASAPEPAPGLAESHRLVFENAPIGIFHFDARGIITACNDAFVAIFGSSRRMVVGLDMQTLPSARVVAALKRTLAGERTSLEGDYRAATSGKVTPVRAELAPILAADGSVSGGVGLVTDVTERQRAVEALRRSEGSFRALIESAPDGMAVHREGHFVYVNRALVRLLAAPSEHALLGTPLSSLLPSPPPVGLDEVLAGRAPSAMREVPLRRLDGGTRVAELAALPLHFDGQPAVLVLARDITERKRIEVALAQADRMASLGTLAAGVAHEINTPLSYVATSLTLAEAEVDALRRGGGGTRGEPQASLLHLASLLHNAHEGTERVRTLVRDLKTFSRGDEELRTWVDLEGVLERALGLVGNELRHRARVVRDYGGVPRIWGNASRLNQVFVNLLVNAVQALPEGGAGRQEVRVRTLALDGHRVAAEVSDTGAGIRPELLGRIFEPFWTTKPVGVGTGLGLSICHGIVTGLGGTISVDSRLGEGSTFRVVLPVGDGPAVEAAPPTPPPLAPAGRPRLLLVDDSPRFAWTLRLALQERYDVVVATSGRDALRLLLEDGGFDLVLCDLMMPDVTGMDVYEDVRRDRPGLEERFVFMTGGAFTPGASAFLQRVPNRRLEKPFRPEAVDGLFPAPFSRVRGGGPP